MADNEFAGAPESYNKGAKWKNVNMKEWNKRARERARKRKLASQRLTHKTT
jgi:hypothetical protein